jgi:hypothetical protein
VQLSREIKTALDSGAILAALAMVYVGIDTMALLACPLGKAEQSKGDFILWVDTYLRAEPDSDYQYEGADVYAARCAMLHSYGSVAGKIGSQGSSGGLSIRVRHRFLNNAAGKSPGKREKTVSALTKSWARQACNPSE